jgi:hypothetical protein
MNKISKHNLLYVFVVCTFLCIKSYGQDIKAAVSVDPKIDELLKEKRKLNSSLFLNEAYKIQIFYGNSEDSKKKLQEFNRELKDLDSTIIFNSPNYKVWVGNFKTRIEVERVMINIKQKYPSALIIKPTK